MTPSGDAINTSAISDASRDRFSDTWGFHADKVDRSGFIGLLGLSDLKVEFTSVDITEGCGNTIFC